MKCFVYGTLKQGYSNHRLLEQSKFIGEAYTEDTFDMLNSGFPVLVPNDNGWIVKGEIYEFSDHKTLDNLDALEGEGLMYDRKEIRVRADNGEPHTVCVYIGNPKYWGRSISMRGKDITDAKYFVDTGREPMYLEWSR